MFVTSYLTIGVPEAFLDSFPPLQNVEICSTTVRLICTVSGLPTLRWFINGAEEARYTHSSADRFPLPVSLESSLPGLGVQILNASSTSIDDINATSVLIINEAVLQNFIGQSFRCGSYVHQSEVKTIRGILGAYKIKLTLKL